MTLGVHALVKLLSSYFSVVCVFHQEKQNHLTSLPLHRCLLDRDSQCSDIVFKAGDQSFAAHKAVLCQVGLQS